MTVALVLGDCGGSLHPTPARSYQQARSNVRKLALKRRPCISRLVTACFENDRRTAVTRTVEVQSASTDVDGLSYPWRQAAASIALPICS